MNDQLAPAPAPAGTPPPVGNRFLSEPLLKFSGLPPGTVDVWQNGFNMVTKSFLGAPIFQLEFDRKQFINLSDHGGQNLYYQVPDYISIDQRGASSSYHMETTLTTESDFENEFGFTVKAEGEEDFVSLSSDTDFSYKGDLFQDSSKFYEVSMFICRTSSFAVVKDPGLLPDFAAGVLLLANLNDPSNTGWTRLFDTLCSPRSIPPIKAPLP